MRCRNVKIILLSRLLNGIVENLFLTEIIFFDLLLLIFCSVHCCIKKKNVLSTQYSQKL